ncbi:tRNA (adenine(22)-N(1))-methyltransferase [Roseiconus lacunae]|uniref:tRNA (Adenine(22)-N(1))-methyltransferase TrmK n=1 Tax=Roseiconus lacunae TaxID=2605694 RepID=A0ABT7PFU1_9BACT|nr:tRNA (adenine(22)-N(1))-methyltransferase TrmK [Roseiconus lacunae]MDM4015357.1 tRNA (adenine(22)-N(1))-methyltransferase TrmK [Roseiconus lacunae]
MTKLDRRLAAVSRFVPGPIHVDVGSDHGYLLRWLLRSGQIKLGIAIEKTETPYQNSCRTLAGLNTDVRLADGLGGLTEGEGDSVSLCGMGGRLIAEILSQFPDRVPRVVITAPNDHPDLVRRWAIEAGFELDDEDFVFDKHPYMIQRFRKSVSGTSADKIYASITTSELDRKIALHFGPILIRRRTPDFIAYLEREQTRLQRLPKRTTVSEQRLEMVKRLLG